MLALTQPQANVQALRPRTSPASAPSAPCFHTSYLHQAIHTIHTVRPSIYTVSTHANRSDVQPLTAGSNSCFQSPGLSTNRRALLGSLPATFLTSTHLLSRLLSAVPPASAAEHEGLKHPSSAERAAIMEALNKVVERTKAPVLLRLPFHDAGTFSIKEGNGGANASICFELDRPESFGLKRGWRIIEQLFQALKGTPAESTVSLADLVVLAGAYAVHLCNGPDIELRIGRPDASGPDPENRLPDENASASQLKASFADKGFSLREFVALSGAHTIGGKGFGGPYSFDNVYYKELLKKPWTNTKDSMAAMIGLPSDKVLTDDAELQPIIQEYADNQDAFFRDFTAAYVKLSELGVPGAR